MNCIKSSSMPIILELKGINNLVMLTPNIVEIYQYKARQVKPSKSFAKRLFYTINNAINKYGETNDVIGIFPESLFWRGWIGAGLHIPGYKIDIRKALEKGKLFGEKTMKDLFSSMSYQKRLISKSFKFKVISNYLLDATI